MDRQAAAGRGGFSRRVLLLASGRAGRRGRVSVGDGRLLASGHRVEHEVCEGDYVLYLPRACTEVRVDGESMILPEHAILAVMTK